MSVDPDMTIHPNSFNDNEVLENRFYIPQRDLLIENKDKEPHEQSAHIQASTIRSKLISLNRFIDFIEERHLYISLIPEHLVNLRRTSNSCKKNLKKLCEERTQEIKRFKSSVLISTNEFQQYGCSDHVIHVCKQLQEVLDDPETFISFHEAIDIRNYLMLNICIVNCLRASNLINMTIHDFQQAKKDNEIQGAYRFYNNKYKTSLVYGEKVILVSDTLHDQMNSYITHVRPIITDDKFRSAKLRYIFTSSTEDTKARELMNQMNHSLVSKCLSRSFEKSKVFIEKKRFASASPSRVRFSVITKLIMLGEDTLDNIAHCFAKHSKETCKKFYVQFFSNREAARLSWKCFQMLNPIKKEEQRAIEMRQSKLSKCSIPTAEKVKSWYQEIKNILKLSKDLDLTDKGLEALIKEFSNELRVTPNEQDISNDEEVPEVPPQISVETSTERVSTLLEDKPHFSIETSTKTTNKILEDNNETVSQIANPSSLVKDKNLNPQVKLRMIDESKIPKKITPLPDFGSVSPPGQNLGHEEIHKESEDDNDQTTTATATNESEIPEKVTTLPDFGSVSPTDENVSEEEEDDESEDDSDTITITATKEEVIKFIKNNFGQVKRFLTTEECKYLAKETSFSKGSVGSFLIGTGINDEINEVIKSTINEMAKVNKCFSLILNNAHPVYVYTVLKIFKEVEIPKGNSVQNKTIINLMDKIFGQQSKTIKETKKYQPDSDESGESEESEEFRESEKSETSDEEVYPRFVKKPKPDKFKIREESSTDDWHESAFFSRSQLLAFIYTFDKFIKNPLHQPHSKECMQKLNDNFIENPTWAEKCNLKEIKFKNIQDLLKAMWRKYQKENDPKHVKYNFFLSLAKTFYKHYLG